jgi:outer membrane protein TolC
MRASRLCRPIAAFALCVGIGAASSAAPPSLDDLVAAALRTNPEVVGAKQKVDEAKARVAEMVAQRKWQVSLSGTVSGSSGEVAEPPEMQSFGTAEASLNFLIPNTAKAGAQVEQAVAQLAAAQAALRGAQFDVAFQTRQACIELRRARDARSIADDNLADALRQEEDTRKRIAAGDVPEADLLKAEVPVAQDRAAFAKAESGVKAAEKTLNSLLQRELDAPIELPSLPREALSKLDVRDAVSQALAHSPDALQARAALAGTLAGLRVARHGRDPDLSFQAGYLATGDPTAYSTQGTLGLTVSLPIFDGGTVSAQVKQAEAQVAQAQTALKAALQQVRLEVEQAILDVQADAASAEAGRQVEDVARRSLDKARQAYAAGLTTTRDVLDAQLVYAQARVDANSAQYDLDVARAHLRQLLGGEKP